MLLAKESVLSLEEITAQHQFSYFQLPASTKMLLRQTHEILFLTISVSDDLAVGSRSVVCIFHKAIIS